MDGFLKQSTAETIRIGKYVDETDGVTVEAALGIVQANVRLAKNGLAAAQKHEASACSHDEGGWYFCALDATDTNTLGLLKIDATVAGACPVYHTYMVVTANVYDTLCSTDTFDVNVLTQANIDFGALQKTSLNAATPALSAAGVDAILDEVIENALSLRQAIMLIKAAVAGKCTGGGTTTINYRDDADTKNRISAVVDANGNRTSVTKDVTP